MTVKPRLLDRVRAKIRPNYIQIQVENGRLWLGLNNVVNLTTTAREAA